MQTIDKDLKKKLKTDNKNIVIFVSSEVGFEILKTIY